jgi:iron complex transport system ATP-binding protein
MQDRAMTAPQGLLRLEGLGYRLPSGKALVRHVGLSLGPGDRLAIVGPNGAGKSSLLRLLAGLLKPTEGRMLIDGQDGRHLSDAQRAQKVAFLPQQLGADMRLSVTDLVALGCLPHAQRWSAQRQRDEVEHCLAVCRLQDLRSQTIGHLSGGELQRANLARTLAQKPTLLLLDEPTNHLDPRASIELLSTVASLPITCVAVLHDLAFVPYWATHVLVMRDGAMVGFGEPAAVLTCEQVEHTFSTPAFYLPHPSHRTPMLVIDRSQSGPARSLVPCV